MKVKTCKLVAAALDWAVAKCEGEGNWPIWKADKLYCQPSNDWAQGGPIIEREKINIRDEVTQWSSWMWDSTRCGDVSYCGPTPLVAAMRCYIASKLGDEVDIPEELV